MTLFYIVQYCYQAGKIVYNVDMNRVFDAVHTANMSKICSSRQEAYDTVDYYLDHPEKGYETPTHREVELNGTKYFVVYNKSTNKILKNINWKEADLNVFLR